MTTLNPNSIIVRDRQRQAPNDLDDNFVASVAKRLIHPIVIRREDGEEHPVLVAGGRRLAAMIKANLPHLTEGTHFRYMDDLSPVEAKTIELEENIKRADLSWRDHASAVGELHKLYSQRENWSIQKTASELNISHSQANLILTVFKNLDSPLLRDSQGIKQSYSILQLAAERRAASIVNEITQTGSAIFAEGKTEDGIESESRMVADNNHNSVGNSGNSNRDNSSAETDFSTNGRKIPPNEIRTTTIPPPIICADFLTWIKDYSGPKFNLIHCDFPYGVDFASFAKSTEKRRGTYDSTKETFDTLLDSFCQNLSKFCSYSAHVVFWFDMNFYSNVKSKLEEFGLRVDPRPLIWFKSDNTGNVPQGGYYRRVYETAFFCTMGNRPVMKAIANCYPSPSPTNTLHPTQKSEPMLRHFLSGIVDETTDVLDPTCGSGAALRAAEDLGARSILGLELNTQYAEAANSTTLMARNMRKISQK